MLVEAVDVNPYENEQLLNMPDGILRPGGFELTKRLVRHAKLMSDARILDIGCGLGSSAAFLARVGFDVVGIDKSRSLIGQGRKRFPKLCLIESSAEKMPFEDDSFDAALIECSLSMMDVDVVLKNIMRILRPHGQLLMSDVFFRTEDEFRFLLRRHGFELVLFEDKTIVFEEFVAQLIMSTGSLDTLFDCGQWMEIKKAKPRYCLAIARKRIG